MKSLQTAHFCYSSSAADLTNYLQEISDPTAHELFNARSVALQCSAIVNYHRPEANVVY